MSLSFKVPFINSRTRGPVNLSHTILRKEKGRLRDISSELDTVNPNRKYGFLQNGKLENRCFFIISLYFVEFIITGSLYYRIL